MVFKLFLVACLTLFVTAVAALERTDFIEEWRHFIHQKGIDITKIDTFAHLKTELKLLEEFGNKQLHRRRPPIHDRDHNRLWTPYRENRVTLSDGTEMSASSIQFSSFSQPDYHNFIASQAPHAHKLELFWQMVIENRINQIVMVTEMKERHRHLCPHYWPAKVGSSLTWHNGITITLLKEKTLLGQFEESIEVRTLEVSYHGKKRLVNHYWYRNWPDGHAPSQTKTILALIDLVKSEKIGAPNPILVHCHAGVGRTGVFLTLYHMLQRKEIGDIPISLFECTAYLRWQRPMMLNRPIQYYFCYQLLRLF